MDNLSDLKQNLVALWVEFYVSPQLIHQEEVARRQEGSEAWDQRRQGLAQSIVTAKAMPEGEYSRLMKLAALDQALADPEWGASWKDEPSLHRVQGADWLLVQRPVALGKSKHFEQSGHIRNWLRYHLIVPERFPFSPSPELAANAHRIAINILPGKGEKSSTGWLDKGSLRVWLGTFPDGVVPDWPELGQRKCTCERLVDPCTRRKSILNSLEEARKGNADVVVLPELAVCPPLQRELAGWLRRGQSGFLLVVPGSFHERDEKQPPGALPYNKTRLFNGDGKEIFWHGKFFPFGNQVCDELITTGNRVTLWMTPIGVVSLAICRDFCEGEGWVRSLWETLSPDWLLVPSMTAIGGIRAHLKQAGHLHDSCGTRVLVANQWPKASYPGKDPCEHGFAFPQPGGERGEQEVTDTPSGRLKILALPGWEPEK